jgi:hypothetical protein
MTAVRRLVWFSCGAASAVAAKLAIEQYGDACEVVYCDTFASEHEDNPRFFADVERWIGRPITVIRSEKYASVDEVIEKRHYMSGPSGATCTVEMKKFPREAYQRPGDIHIFGYTAGEEKRAERFEDQNPSLLVEWTLIDQGIGKEECLSRVSAAGIALPVMYEHFDHNNCKGCVKSSSPGYWNKTRRLFPDVFDRRVRQSHLLGVRLVRIKGERRFLNELPLDEDAPDDAIECGPVCQTSFDWSAA